MGCRNDYMEPTKAEAESKKIARHIVYIEDKLNKPTLEKIRIASMNSYGWKDGLHEMTAHLCNLLKTLSKANLKKIVYNAYCFDSRRLADWWEQHQEDDLRHEEEDKEVKEKQEILNKLTSGEIKTLGLK